MKNKFLYDAQGDVARVVHYNAEDGFFGDFAVELIQDLEPLIEQNKLLREASRPGQVANDGALGTLMGRVPAFIIEKADREQWQGEDWERFFNDPDNAVFKTFYGRM